jgi:hypothetical protein
MRFTASCGFATLIEAAGLGVSRRLAFRVKRQAKHISGPQHLRRPQQFIARIEKRHGRQSIRDIEHGHIPRFVHSLRHVSQDNTLSLTQTLQLILTGSRRAHAVSASDSSVSAASVVKGPTRVRRKVWTSAPQPRRSPRSRARERM